MKQHDANVCLQQMLEHGKEAVDLLSGKGKNDSIPWREIIGMRNRLVHGYDAIDLNVLWDTIRMEDAVNGAADWCITAMICRGYSSSRGWGHR